LGGSIKRKRSRKGKREGVGPNWDGGGRKEKEMSEGSRGGHFLGRARLAAGIGKVPREKQEEQKGRRVLEVASRGQAAQEHHGETRF